MEPGMERPERRRPPGTAPGDGEEEQKGEEKGFGGSALNPGVKGKKKPQSTHQLNKRKK